MPKGYDLGTLNQVLFHQLYRLQREDLHGDKLKDEIQRANATGMIATSIISSGELALKAQSLAAKSGSKAEVPDALMIEGGEADEGNKGEESGDSTVQP